MFAEIGEGCYIEPPLHANWGGHHVHFGKGVYANFNLTLVDDTHIYVGDYTLIGPNVVIASAGHPIEPGLREQAYQYNMPVRIGRNCWLGAGVIVVPGVTIGDNVVIGAGSVVTKVFTDIVQIIYSTDTSTNVCPSIHVLNSLGVFISIIESEALRKKKVICVGSGVLSVLICLSTVFLKQHSVIDGLCALGLAIVLYAFIYKANYTKLLLRMEEEEQKTRTKQQKEIG